MKLPIYFDNQATTPVDPRVLDAMMPFLTTTFGNAASRSHSFGWAAEQAVEVARSQVAKLIGASPKEIVFTSGATESNNLALKGVVESARTADPARSVHIVTQTTEHNAVLDPCRWLKNRDAASRCYPSSQTDASPWTIWAARSTSPPPALVSVMFANNEIGTIQPISEIGALCRERGVLFHTDGAQAAGKFPSTFPV